MEIKIYFSNSEADEHDELEIPEGEQRPRIIDGRTYVPLRWIFDNMGYEFEWEKATHYDAAGTPRGTATATDAKGNTIIIWEGEKYFETNGVRFTNPDDLACEAVGGRIMIPVRGVLESAGCRVKWDAPSDEEGNVYITPSLEGCYRIKNTSGKYLSYANTNFPSDTPVQVAQASNDNYQIWKIEASTEAGKYHIKPAIGTVCGLNVYGVGDGAYPCTIQSIFQYPADTSFRITCVPGYNYTVAWENATNVRYLTDNGSQAGWSLTETPQEWVLEEAEIVVPSLEGHYRIKNASGKYLTYAESESNNNPPLQVTQATGDNYQIWKVELSSIDGKYHIKSVINEARGLNVYRSGTFPCTAYEIEGNEEDTSFGITGISESNYTIAWEDATNTRYLTDDGSQTNWSLAETPQEWVLEEAEVILSLEGYYRIKNASGKYLSYANTNFPSDTPVQVAQASNDNYQIWKIEASTEAGKYHIKPATGTVCGLNVYGVSDGAYPCTIQSIFQYPADTSFRITCVPGYNYTVTWENATNVRYLTDNGSQAGWSLTETPQEWILEVAEFTAPVENTSISLPLNISQTYFEELHGQCGATCALDIAVFYEFDSYDNQYHISSSENLASKIQRIIDDNNGTLWSREGLLWQHIEDFDFDNSQRKGNVSENVILSKARESILNNTPMMLHYYTEVYDEEKQDYVQNNTHWVVVVGCDANTTSIDDLIVCDPSTRENKPVNTPWTLSASKTYNMRDVSSFRYGYVTTQKNVRNN